jgi:DHA1 family bicyclomycin/chloramphenicol resistance-like MFS transporter
MNAEAGVAVGRMVDCRVGKCAASALLGFWQMMVAAIGVWLVATISHQAMFALGAVLATASLVALGLYAMRTKAA